MRILSAMLTACVVLAGRAEAAELALKRVLLSSAGVGYFEYEAEVDGPASLSLSVKLDQVDDVLKSLVVFDDLGSVGGIELPGLDQARNAFGNVPFGPEALASPLAYLNSLQGVEVIVQGPRPMAGRMIRAETVPTQVPGTPGATQTRTRVSVLTADGLKQFVLEDSDAVQVTDPDLRARIERALGAARRQSDQDSRTVTIRSRGAGPRSLRVGYVALAPLWKASYRLVLPPLGAVGEAAKARLQGWATLENASAADWSDVAIAVQYGNPVTFHQALYRSYFVTRPEVPVEVLGRLLPDVDRRARNIAVPPPPPPVGAMAPAPASIAAPKAMREMALAAPAEPVPVQEGGEETVFAIPVAISLAAGHTASVPILDRAVPAARVALARPGQPHPLATIQLTNDTGASLPAGVLTLYDAQSAAPYAGDARLGGLPAGEERLVAYAQDLRTGLEWRDDDETTLVGITAAAGVLTVDRRQRRVTHVTLTAPAGEPRRVLLDVDKGEAAQVAAGLAQPQSETATAWRFAVDLRPGDVIQLTYALDRMQQQAITLLDDDSDTVATLINLQGASAAARAGLRGIAELRARESARTAERDRLVQQREAVEADETRLRANLGALQSGDAVRSRLVRQLDADETRHGELSRAIDAAEAAVTQAHQALLSGIEALRF